MKKREKQKWKRYVIGILTCMLLLGSISPVYAVDKGGSSDIDDAIETGTVTAIGDTTITTKKDGAVVIEMTAKTASNDWKWRTIGYYLTKNKLSVSSANLSGAAGSGVKSSHVLWVDEVHTCKVRGCPYYGKPDGTRDDTSKNGVTTTKITIDKACITAHRNAAGIKLDSGEETLSAVHRRCSLMFWKVKTMRNIIFTRLAGPNIATPSVRQPVSERDVANEKEDFQ